MCIRDSHGLLVMGDHHLGKHDVRVVVIGGDLPVLLSRRPGGLGRLSGSRHSAGAEVVASVLPDSVASPQAARARVEPFRVIWGQWREVVDQWTAVDAGVGVACSSFDSAGAR